MKMTRPIGLLLVLGIGAGFGTLGTVLLAELPATAASEEALGELFARARLNNPWLFKQSFDKGFDVNAVDPSGENTLLMEAVTSGSNDVVRYLLANGAAVDTLRNGTSAFLLAASKCNVDAASLLADKDPFLAKDPDYRQYALQIVNYEYYKYERECSAQENANEWELPTRNDCGFWPTPIEPPCSGVIEIVLRAGEDGAT